MLLDFRCKNFRSFKDEASLSMLPIKAYKEHADNVVPAHLAGESAGGVLSSAVIMGTNASGKTNLLRAVDFARGMVLGAFHPSRLVKRPNFVGCERPTSFDFSFVHGGLRFDYGLSFDAIGVVDEELRVRPKGERLVFRRSRAADGSYNVKQGSKYTGISTRLRGYEDRGPVLGMLSKYGIDACEQAYDWFEAGLVIMNRDAPIDYGFLVSKLARLQEGQFKQAITAIESADLGIVDAQIAVDDMTEEDRALQQIGLDKLKAVLEALTGGEAAAPPIPDKKVALQFRHVIDGRGVGFGLEDESLGTVTMLDLAADMLDALANGKTLFVDEAERSLHPVLLKNLVGLFSNRELNKTGAQLVFTTHDLSFLSNGLLRRDQIWFVQKDMATGASELYPLSSFSPRKDESLINRYLYGAYGAVPFVELDGVLSDGR